MVSEEKKSSIILVVILAVFSVMILSMANGKELPQLVEISELSECCDNKRVVIIVYGRSSEAVRGRLGSTYAHTIVGEGQDDVIVYSTFPVFNMIGNKVIVQGVYHKEGRFGGLLMENFIVAEHIERYWD